MTSERKENRKEEEKPYVIVDYLDIEVDKIEFGAAKKNAHGGHFIPIRYGGKAMYVRYGARTCPFGLSTSTEEKDEYAGKYVDKKKITGYSTSISCEKEYESDPYYEKGEELDKFFMEACHENARLWHLGGTEKRPLGMDAIEGYDERGADGKWKRLLKWSYKKDKEGNREYLDYPPRYEFGIPTTTTSEHQGDDGVMVQEATLKPVFFDVEGKKMGSVRVEGGKPVGGDVLPNFSKVSVLAHWSTITQGTYGATLKPKAQQFRVYPNERLATDECLLDDEEEEYDVPDQFGGEEVKKVESKPMEIEIDDGAEEEEEEEVEVVKPTRVVRPKRVVKSKE